MHKAIRNKRVIQNWKENKTCVNENFQKSTKKISFINKFFLKLKMTKNCFILFFRICKISNLYKYFDIVLSVLKWHFIKGSRKLFVIRKTIFLLKKNFQKLAKF